MERLTLDVRGLTFDAVAAGPDDGRPMLLLHGFPQSSWSWRHVMADVADAGVRAVAVDQRGYSLGARPTDVQDYAMPHLVGDALGLLDALGWPTADVVGHDWGAAVAWQLAGRHAQRVRTLTAVSVPHPIAFVEALRSDADQRRRSQYMKDFGVVGVAEQALLSESGRWNLAAVLAGCPDPAPYLARMREPGALTAALSWYRAQSLADIADLGAVTMPTLYVWSDSDPAVGEAAALGTSRYVDALYRFEVLRGIDHWVPENAPAELTGLVLAHLAAH